ncbi:MAG: cytochrome b [Rhizobiales bacterium]|nr:cytochrome b [Hyphomicrobiales bacterium]
MRGGTDVSAERKVFLASLHVSFGTIILLLSVFRLAWRLINPPPPLPATMARWEVALGKATHLAFYAMMTGMPVTGWLSLPSHVARRPYYAETSIVGLILTPLAPDLGLPAGRLHSLGAKLGMVLIGLHVLAALKHQFFDRNGLLRRMSPL